MGFYSRTEKDQNSYIIDKVDILTKVSSSSVPCLKISCFLSHVGLTWAATFWACSLHSSLSWANYVARWRLIPALSSIALIHVVLGGVSLLLVPSTFHKMSLPYWTYETDVFSKFNTVNSFYGNPYINLKKGWLGI